MAFQQGSVRNLPAGSQDVTVVFDPPFTATPAVILPAVSNGSNDAVKYLIQAEVVAEDRFGFSVRLTSPPNTGNYSLDWVAGDTETMFQLASVAGLKITQLPVLEALPFEADRLLVTVMSPLPVNYTLPWGLVEAFIRQQGGTDISASPSTTKVPQWGNAALSVNATAVTVTLATPVVNEPYVTATLENQNADDPLAMIGGIVTNKLKDGNGLYNRFVYTFTAPIPTANYKLVWQAVESS